MIWLETGFVEKLCNEKWCMEDVATTLEAVCPNVSLICSF